MVQCVNKKYSPTASVRTHLLELLKLLGDSNAAIVATHLAGHKNTVSDALSRVSMGDNWKLSQVVFRVVQSLSTPCTIDRFATANNAVLPAFNSYFYEAGCAGIDAFAQVDWLSHINFVHPPVSIMGRVVQFLAYEQPACKAVVIFPMWASQPWYMHMLRLCTVVYLLPYNTDQLF